MALFNSLIPSVGRTLARRESAADQNLGPTLKPLYEIKETDDAYGVTVYLPGVAKDGANSEKKMHRAMNPRSTALRRRKARARALKGAVGAAFRPASETIYATPRFLDSDVAETTNRMSAPFTASTQ